jgi:mannose-6-phosphate isomerase-like protein (cupin superfamily)
VVHSPDECVIHLRVGERVTGALSDLLDPVDIASMHEYVLPAHTPVELHYHDMDEYWLFVEGHPTVTLRLPDGTTGVYHLAPGDMVATLRGVEHTLHADHTLRYIQFTGQRRPDARGGHLTRP